MKRRSYQPRLRPITCDGTRWTSVAALARAYGKPPSTVRARLAKGLSPEQAIELPRMRRLPPASPRPRS